MAKPFFPSALPVEQNAHTLARPYCRKLSCWCRTSVAYHVQVTGSSSADGAYRGSPLKREVDDAFFEYATMTLLGGGQR